MSAVTLDGGPFDGLEVQIVGGGPLAIQGDPVPEGNVARYTATRDKAVYRFRGVSKVVATLPLPGAQQ